MSLTYRGWKKSCTTLDGWNPINNGINHLSTGAGFLPSTVSPKWLVQAVSSDHWSVWWLTTMCLHNLLLKIIWSLYLYCESIAQLGISGYHVYQLSATHSVTFPPMMVGYTLLYPIFGEMVVYSHQKFQSYKPMIFRWFSPPHCVMFNPIPSGKQPHSYWKWP